MNECRTHYKEYIAQKRLALEHTNFVHAQHIDPRQAFNKKIGITQKHDIVLLDLGFSSYQLEDMERGFSYMGNDDQPLDMRFNIHSPDQSTAMDIINGATELELCEILKKFGEERFHTLLAQKIVEGRVKLGKVKTTGDLK